MLFFGSAEFAQSRGALELVQQNRTLFDDSQACFFGVTVNPSDAGERRVAQELPGIRFFLDYDRGISSLYGAASADRYAPFWIVLDPSLRVLRRFAICDGAEALAFLRGCIEVTPDDTWAPVLQVPNVFEPEFCDQLISYYEREGGDISGFMRDVEGRTVGIHDPAMKQRRDCYIQDIPLRQAAVARLVRRLNPAIERALQFRPTRIERHIIGCYEEGAGHFRPHRDNITKGTAHRKFAVTINLNAGDYEGGDLRFPEFGSRTYCAPTGGALVFSCSLLHEATPVLKGKRYAFLPFLYDEEGARVRQQNSETSGQMEKS
jgi:predicted 2-oxoglutarate/Fe(II)-dependent dioxygenase YbiX